MAVPCRCNRKICQHRRSLAMKPDHYARGAPRCHRCGKGRYRTDPYRCRVERKIKPCICHGYGFPHTPAHGWCIHNTKGPPEGTQAQRSYEADRLAEKSNKEPPF